MSDYQRIASAIDYIRTHLREQPTLEQIAGHIHLSPYHFQRMFSRWAGVTPKRFLQVLTLEHARPLLDQAMPLLDISAELGLSSASRLYDHFVTLQAITPGEYKTRGSGVRIEYSVQQSPFGDVFMATTRRGLCKMAFVEQQGAQQALAELQEQWPAAELQASDGWATDLLSSLFDPQRTLDRPLSLLVSGSNFQVNVWRALLQIPAGKVTSYGGIANALGHAKAARAVANAVAANPIALLIPCHRVICANGDITGYRWGSTRKHAILAWEAAQAEDSADAGH